jgi:hypothetical protein
MAASSLIEAMASPIDYYSHQLKIEYDVVLHWKPKGDKIEP